MPRAGRAKNIVLTKKKPTPGGGGGTPTYLETFSGGVVPLGWTGYHWGGGSPVHDDSVLSVVSGKLRLTATATTKPSAYSLKTLGQMQSGTTILLSAVYASAGGGVPFFALCVNADGTGAFLSSGNLATDSSGTYTNSATVPAGDPTVYLNIYNNSAATSTVDVDSVSATFTAYVAPGGGVSTLYSQDFSTGTLPAGWSGRWYDGSAVQAGNEPLSFVGGKIRVTVNVSANRLYAGAKYAFTGLTPGQTLQILADFVTNGTGLAFVRVTENASGATSGLIDSGNRTGAATYAASFTVPTGVTTLYLFLFNDIDSDSYVDFDNVALTTAPGPAFLSSKFPVSYAGRGIPLRHMLSTDAAPGTVTFSIVSGQFDATEFSITNGNVLNHSTGAAGKKCVVRATRTSDSVTTDQTITLYQKAAIGTTSGLATNIYYTSWSDHWVPTAMDYSAAEFWMIFGVKPDDTGVMEADAQKYFDQGAAWGYNAGQGAAAAGKKPILVFGGGPDWGKVYAAISDDTKRANIATALIAEMDRIGAVGIDLDMEKNSSSVTPQEWIWKVDLARKLREARPDMYLTAAESGIANLKNGPPDQGRLPEFTGYCDQMMLMTYSMFLMGDPSHWTWYETPLHGAKEWHTRLDAEETLRQLEAINVFNEKLMLGGSGFVEYAVGPTAPDQPAYGFSTSLDIHDQYEWLATDSYFGSNATDHYDIWRKATYRRVNPASSGWPDTSKNGVTYVAYLRSKDYADWREFCKAKHLVGVGFWQTLHSSVYATFSNFHSAITTNSPAASSDPTYTSGTLIASENYDSGGVPAEWSAYASGPGGFGEYGAAPLAINAGKLRIQTGGTYNYIYAKRQLTGLTIGQLYSVIFDLTSSAASGGAMWVGETGDTSGQRYFITNLPVGVTQTGYLYAFSATATTHWIYVVNNTGDASTIDIDNLAIRAVAWDTVG